MSKKETIMGVCHLCGKYTELTREHIPPKGAFNKSKLYSISGDSVQNILQNKDFKPKIKQNGSYVYSLCKSCNNNTGAWYADDYINLCKEIASTLLKNKDSSEEWFTIEAKSVKIGNIIKQIFCMFVSTMDNKLVKKYGIDKYLLEKDNFELDTSQFKLYCYINSKYTEFNSTGRLLLFRTDNKTYDYLSLKTFPIGFILNLNPYCIMPEWKKMLDMEELIKAKNDEVDLVICMPIMNNYHEPFDNAIRNALDKKLESVKKLKN